MKTPICPPPTRATGGFTLIELLVVLTVVSLLAAVLVGKLGGSDRMGRQKAAQELRTAFATAKLRAQRNGQVSLVEPAALVGTASVVRSDLPTKAGAVAFYPDGSSSGGLVRLAEVPLLEVDWLSGEVRDAR